MSYELTGKVKIIQDAQTFSSGFSKRPLIVTVEDGKFPQDISIEFLQDKVALLDALAIGQEVKVSFDIRGREYNEKYFNNLVGWKLECIGQAQPAPANDAASDADDLPVGDFDSSADIPF